MSETTSFMDFHVALIEMERDRDRWQKIANDLAETSTCKVTSHFVHGCPYECKHRKAKRNFHGIVTV